jgi:hypothetical protein
MKLMRGLYTPLFGDPRPRSPFRICAMLSQPRIMVVFVAPRKACSFGQSTLSRCVRQLEVSIGMAVFERSSGGNDPPRLRESAVASHEASEHWRDQFKGSIVPCAVARRDFSVAAHSPSPQALDCELEWFQVSVARA